MAGRRPVPTKLRVLRGNPGKRPLPKGEPQPAIADTSNPPAYLVGYALEKWQSIAPRLAELGLLTILDVTALAVYCTCYATWREAQEMVAKEGMTVETEGGRRLMHPAVQIAKEASIQMHKWAVEFGFTPASRPKLAGVAAPQEDPLEAFLSANRKPCL